MLKFIKLSEDAIAPKRAYLHDAGLDLFAAESKIIPPKERATFKTDIALEIPINFYGRILPRSGLAVNKGIDVGAGVIDSCFRGNVTIVLFNHSNVEVKITQGMRIAQIIVQPYLSLTPIEVKELSTTIRGAYGLGSSDL